MNYQTADTRLQGRNSQSRKYANNTYLVRRDDNIALRYHETDVVTFLPNGDIVLDSGGWHTSTTKERIGYAVPRIFQKLGRWYVGFGGKTHAYADGMVLKADGTVEGAGVDRPKADKAMKARIKAYAQQCADQTPMDEPSGGDCWHCYMGLPDESKKHLDMHMQEGYVVPSLVYKAMKATGLDPQRNVQFSLVFGTETIYPDLAQDTVKRSVTRYMQRELGFAA